MSEGSLPILRASELIRALERLGFRRTDKRRGSHRRYARADGRKATVPFTKAKPSDTAC